MVTVSRCLGSMIECDGNVDLDVDARLAVARSIFNQLHPLWKSTTLSTRVKLKIFRVSVGMTARHGSEAWTPNEETLKKLRGWCSSCPVLHHRPNPQGRGGHRQLVRRHRDHPRPEAGVPRQRPAPERRREPEDRHQAHQDGGRRVPSGVHIHGHAGTCGHATSTLRLRQRHGRVGQTHQRHLPGEEEQRRRRRAAQLIRIQLTFFTH